MKTLTTLAVAVALSLSGSLYASADQETDRSHDPAASNAKSAQHGDNQHVELGDDDVLATSNDITLAAKVLAGQLTDDEHVIEVRYDDAGHVWAVVLGGYCESENDCVQYTRQLSLDAHDHDADKAGGSSLGGAPLQGGNLIDAVAALPSVHMAHVVIQAQVEPFRGNQSALAGDADVMRVQSGLNAKGISTTVDGWYGNGTTSAYATWQRRLGYTGLDATGIPGPSSLAALGQNRFVLTNKITVGSKTTFSGKRVNTRTRSMLREAERLFGRSITVTQGSYNAGGVGASAGTHDGGGAVDISVSSLSETQRWQLVRALRKVGFAAWYRTAIPGTWAAHIHAIAIGDTDMSLSARNQVADYYVGRNGLAGHGADNTPSAYRVPFTWWEKY
ncbi:MAG TPA: peptidoglycan-binding domain-containing protein [Dokdonella sp.]|uniref:peptidoglycan-binding domain-containing protein n=1 Tax=Dokdonella sp. TaxID=2291710 RepID=UPI0025C3C1F8|nr:peptidoglycan-binding domain-containing protein [Dokdonella sp.]MBX3691179.1 peptidoglycan-binding protein [Dokdonella sp.]MCW5566980.1 peptidoglycan-binding protein [Dokdonella sp.]HNR91008.1 peptidoglycan-binding domain-containing protein [Dokdonella sp.]